MTLQQFGNLVNIVGLSVLGILALWLVYQVVLARARR